MLIEGVHHRVRSPLHVGPQLMLLLRCQRDRIDRIPHMVQPAVPHRRRHRERGMAHAQPRVSALLAVGGWAAPILLQEHAQPLFGRSKVSFGIEGAQWGVECNPFVEPLHKCNEGLVAADGVVESLQRCLFGHRDPLCNTDKTGWQDETAYATSIGRVNSWLQFGPRKPTGRDSRDAPTSLGVRLRRNSDTYWAVVRVDPPRRLPRIREYRPIAGRHE